MNSTHIKNIIFDLGGIFLNIDYSLTEKAFIELGVTNFADFYTQHNASTLFEDLETGKITPEDFCDALRTISTIPLTNEQIYTAWNAMLLDLPTERLIWLEVIRQRYNVYLYSNTNKIHYQAFLTIAKKVMGEKHFNDYFIKAYYSHELGLRKPYAASYTAILHEQNLAATETLFIDDTIKNIEGAAEAGLQTLHLIAPQTVLDIDL
jgi:FMN phosphatase YigB (HAD superfamily)